MQKYFKILGLNTNATDEEIENAYQTLKNQYSRDRFLEGELGNIAAKNLTKLENAYSEIKEYKKQSQENSTGKTISFFEVENLIKLIKIRILATECSISVIREAGGTIRIYTPFTQYEWNILKTHLNKDLLRRVKITNTPKACIDGKSIILVNIEHFSIEEIFNILTSLFYDIKKGVNVYLAEN